MIRLRCEMLRDGTIVDFLFLQFDGHSGASGAQKLPCPVLMLWTAPPPARECY
jgi:hypothetical protein